MPGFEGILYQLSIVGITYVDALFVWQLVNDLFHVRILVEVFHFLLKVVTDEAFLFFDVFDYVFVVLS